MHIVNDYVFDADRLIFFKKDLPNNIQQKIQELIPTSDNYDVLISKLDKLDAHTRTVKNKPINLIGLCLTYNCSLRCNYCSYSSGSDRIDYLSVNDIIAFVIHAIKKRIVSNTFSTSKNKDPLRFFFTGGGEPTCNWKLFKESVEAIKNKCREYNVPYYLELTTNGMISYKQREFIIENFNSVMVSYDGCPEIQNINRPCLNNKKNSNVIVEKTIKDFINSSLKVTIRSTVWHYDFDNLKKMCDYMYKNFAHFDEWSIMPIIPSGRALENDDISQCYNIKNFNFLSYYIDLINYIKKSNYHIYISTPIFNNTVAQFCCGATFVDCFWLMPDKKIITCIEAERFRVEIGKIENGRVDLYDQYYDHLLETVINSFKECRNCISYRFCKGGCPLKSIRDMNYNTTYRQYECSMIQQYWIFVFNNVVQGNECFGWIAEQINDSYLEQYNVLRLVRTKEIKNDN